ncbi:hypothetical protein [Bradyrhizobium sp. AUGA SZCCT0431]|uniref:restriction endonuclease subunit S n=1 Tax=Bradyrhizobium sp. AUGA SZCCT0431 TaxID=2807674 RepID=UPI001BA8B99C|nr:hypothetical protein [Bradyrhizobium sp. AUGA SZCCT0431]MBR1141725.1 hypothetical protein [Bradyrhizobium sp. AUGA SZCCT0431]
MRQLPPLADGWRYSTLGALIEPSRPITYGVVQPGEHSDEGVPLVRGGDFSRGWRPLDQMRRITPEIDSHCERGRLRTGDLVITIKGAEVGVAAQIPHWLDGANISQTNARLAINPAQANPRYILQFLHSPLGRFEVYQHTKVGAQPGLIFEDIASFNVPMPPELSWQDDIVALFDLWDSSIEKIQRLIALKEKRALAASQLLYLGSMPGAKSEGTEDWLDYSFSDIFEEVFDKNPGLCASDVITVGKYAIRPQNEHFNRSVASKELSSYLLLEPGDFVYDPMSAYYGAIGRYTRASPGIVSPAYRVLHLRQGFDPSYIDGLLKSHYVRFQLQARSSQNNKEGKRRLLDREEFSAIRVRAPLVAAQEQIAAILRTFNRDLEASREVLAALQRQKRGLMQKLLTGEWRAPVRDGDVDAMAARVTEEAAQ